LLLAFCCGLRERDERVDGGMQHRSQCRAMPTIRGLTLAAA
jgi:hypothetical protein